MLKVIFTLLVVVAVVSTKQSNEHQKSFKKTEFKSHVQHNKHLDEFQRFNPNNLFALFSDYKLANNQTAFLIVLNERVNDLMSISSTAGTVYLWDVLYPKLRVRLLKSVNYTLTANESLSWMSLAMNVQNDLMQLKFNFAKNRKLSDISVEILAILEQVRFDLLISVDLLKEKISSIIFKRIDQAIAYLQNSTYMQSHKHASSKGDKHNGKDKSFLAKLKRHESNEQSDEVATPVRSDYRAKRSVDSWEFEESNESSEDDNDEDEEEEEDYEQESRRKRSAESKESEESNENLDEESRRKRSIQRWDSLDEDDEAEDDNNEYEYIELRRKRGAESNQHGKGHKAAHGKKDKDFMAVATAHKRALEDAKSHIGVLLRK